MLRLLLLLMCLSTLISCDIFAELEEVEKDAKEAVQLIKAELNVEPNIHWIRQDDLIRVTVQFNSIDVKDIDTEILEQISKRIVKKVFEPTPDEIQIELVNWIITSD